MRFCLSRWRTGGDVENRCTLNKRVARLYFPMRLNHLNVHAHLFFLLLCIVNFARSMGLFYPAQTGQHLDFTPGEPGLCLQGSYAYGVENWVCGLVGDSHVVAEILPISVEAAMRVFKRCAHARGRNIPKIPSHCTILCSPF